MELSTTRRLLTPPEIPFPSPHKFEYYYKWVYRKLGHSAINTAKEMANVIKTVKRSGTVERVRGKGGHVNRHGHDYH